MDEDSWAEALTWHNTFREGQEKDLTTALAREWQHWYANAENRRTFENVTRLLADRRVYHKRNRPSRAELEADRYDVSIPVAEWRKTHTPEKKRSLPRHWWRSVSGRIAVAAAAAIAVLVFGWSLRLLSEASLSDHIVYQTRAGQVKDIQLRDGSSIILGAQTELSVDFSRQIRSVRLFRGQAWFKVVHDPHRPFVVAAGHGTIRDVGTAFLVTRDSDRVVVTVTDGTVEVTTLKPGHARRSLNHAFAPIPALTPIRIYRGEEVVLRDNGALSPVRLTDTHAATAWIRGRLIFEDQPLRYVIETVDRYSSLRITVSPSAGVLRFSGIVFEDEVDEWLQGLEKIFPVTIEDRGVSVCVHLRDSEPVRMRDESCATQ